MGDKLEQNIITLIEDNIANYKLIETLSNIGIDASPYYLNSAFVIFDLLGFTHVKRRDSLHYEYVAMLKNASRIDIVNNRKELRETACRIYTTISKVEKSY